MKHLQENLGGVFQKIYEKWLTRVFLLALGAVFLLPAFLYYLLNRKNSAYKSELAAIRLGFKADGTQKAVAEEVRAHVEKKFLFFRSGPAFQAEPDAGPVDVAPPLENAKAGQGIEKEVARLLEVRLDEMAKVKLRKESPGLGDVTFAAYVSNLLQRGGVFACFVVFGFPAFLFLLLMGQPFLKYTFERLVMMVFVVFGVTFLVFTILYISPMDASYNILGDLATDAQRAQFNAAYGLDKPYLEQLWRAFKGIATLHPGKSLMGGQEVMAQLANKFPITLRVTFFSLALAVAIAVPAGIFSALRPYSVWDYLIMLLALIGLSIPAFWFGMLLILEFSITLHWLPSIFLPGNLKVYVMPAIVMGTGLSASIARMTRSSMLEVIHQDYIVTAKAKGLPAGTVILRHALGNAMIPIVTIIGLDFGAMMAGATVAEKVFSIPGIGSWLIDKQFIPDTPAVLAGVVYIAIIVSVVNLVVDLLYALLDPRIKAKIKLG
ncbi:MAG: ABC transporter permease [Lachnospiraceae bacterium]|jgi:peptide/nickel transport system permease protein|nr:ABC transporter permease [Lachnospiraceae bacterium]